MSHCEENSVVERQSLGVFSKANKSLSSVDISTEDWSSLLFDLVEHTVSHINVDVQDVESGEICTKYTTMSDSAVQRHPYYSYPVIEDPGIEEALFFPEASVIYPDDGQKLYLDICKEMNICPVRCFHRGLLLVRIDLRYYGINPVGIRAMCMALRVNKIVQIIDLTDNFLTVDSCYHLGVMLRENNMLKELNLSGCRIGPEGARHIFTYLPMNRTLRALNLSRNKLEDDGINYLAKAILKGSNINLLNLSHNQIEIKGAQALAEALEANNKLTHFDLSWNHLYPVPAVCSILRQLSQSKVLRELNLSWNSLMGEKTGLGLKNLLTVPNLEHLDLSNNKLDETALTQFGKNLVIPKKMITLNLSYNPMSPETAYKLLTYFKNPKVKIKKFILENVLVTPDFVELSGEIKKMKSRQDTVFVWGDVLGQAKSKHLDIRDLLLNRIEYIAKKPKKLCVDIALFTQQFIKQWESGFVPVKNFTDAVRAAGVAADDDLITELAKAFPGPIIAKSKSIDLPNMIDFMKRKWPDRKLPPTPPPEPETKPEPDIKKKPKKGKK